MGICPSETKRNTFCEAFFERLQIACTNIITMELMDVSRLWDLNKKKVEELLYILRSEV